MSFFDPQKTVTPAEIDCLGTAAVTIGFRAAAELSADPADIVLILDRSGSMALRRLFFLKTGAGSLIEMVAEASTGDPAFICNSREFQAQVIANYVDTDFACCDGQTEIV